MLREARRNAFRRGFAAGMASPYTALGLHRRRYNTGPTDLVTLSWQQVGQSIKDAINSENQKHGKASGDQLKAS